MPVHQESFGLDVDCFTISNMGGMVVKCTEYGATILSVVVPDHQGVFEEVTLCYATLDELRENPGPYYGCIAGRVANRISQGKFSLHGQEYQLEVNNGRNSLHGGFKGFDKQTWKAMNVISTADNCGVKFEYISRDSEGHYPGNLRVR